MKRNLKYGMVLALLTGGCLAMSGCGEKRKVQDVFVPDKQNPTVQTADPHAGMVRSNLTGEWIEAALENAAPIAVMYNNVYDAMPQSGIEKADVVMEAYAEGGVTRLMCIFKDWKGLAKIGPVRSCRLYYLETAKEFEAIYIHFGYSEYAAEALKKVSNHALDGMVYCNFYRSDDRVAPHNAYTTGAGILGSVLEKKYPTTLPAGYQSPFRFSEETSGDAMPAEGRNCTHFEPGYVSNKPWFEYQAQSGLYQRFQYGAPQTDKESGAPLAYKNIVVKYVTGGKWENGTPNYQLSGSGQGLYITNGKAREITWIKEKEGPTLYYYQDGSRVLMNPGKTWLCLVEAGEKGNVVIRGEDKI